MSARNHGRAVLLALFSAAALGCQGETPTGKSAPLTAEMTVAGRVAGVGEGGAARAFVRVEIADSQWEGEACENVTYRPNGYGMQRAPDGRFISWAIDVVERTNWCVRVAVAGEGGTVPIGEFGPPRYLGRHDVKFPKYEGERYIGRMDTLWIDLALP